LCKNVFNHFKRSSIGTILWFYNIIYLSYQKNMYWETEYYDDILKSIENNIIFFKIEKSLYYYDNKPNQYV